MTPRKVCGAALLHAALFAWVLRPLWDIDVFFHIAIGRHILAHGVPSTDIFSAATPEAAWTPFQLGYALLAAALDAAGGLDLVRVVDAALTSLAMVVLLGRLSRMTSGRAATFLLFAVFLVLYDDRIRPRPHLWNLLFEVTLLLPFATGARVRHEKRMLVGIFAASVVWGFMHAMGALWLVAVLGTRLFAPDREERRFGMLACLASLSGILLAPGAAGGVLHVLRIQDQWREFVPELAPAWAFYAMGDAYGYTVGTLPWVAALLVAYAALQRPAREQLPRLLSAAGFAFGALWLARLCYYATFAIALVWPLLSTSPLGRTLAPARARTLAIGAGAALCILIVAHVAPRFLLRGVNPWTTTLYPGTFPVAEADALAAMGIEARAYNEMPWGGYLLYRLHPRVRVISDGRITFTPEVAELLRREKDAPAEVVAEVAHRRFGIDLLFWRRGRMPQTREWRLIVRGPLAEVWARAR